MVDVEMFKTQVVEGWGEGKTNRSVGNKQLTDQEPAKMVDLEFPPENKW